MVKQPSKHEVSEVKEKIALPEEYDLAMLQQDSGAGVDNMSADDIALPYLGILQSNSPQVQPGRPEYIEGAQASMFYNTVSQEIYDGRTRGLMFVPCAYERRYVEWVDREAGGGYVADYDIDSDILSYTKKDERGRPRMPTGNLIVETAYHTGLFLDPETESWMNAVVALKSSGLKVNRRWNNELVTSKVPGTELQAPRWLYAYHLTTSLETKKNNSWYQLHIEKGTIVSKAVYDKAKQFHKLVVSGGVKRAVEKDPVVDDAPRNSSDGGDNSHDSDIPF